MANLIIRRGIQKRAADEDGPSFEQQFGILANAMIADKYPKLDQMKLAFQLIEKNDDNSEACGAAVYVVGGTVIFIPAFFKNNKLKTGDMMFIPQTQQFIPLSDPWLSWVMNKNLPEAGTMLPEDSVEAADPGDADTIRQMEDPIIKTACVYLRGLLHTAFDPEAHDGANVFDTALGMGKEASEHMLDNLIGNAGFLNAALRFYNGDSLDTFAKKASALVEEQAPAVTQVVLPFTKEAKELNEFETSILQRDGYFIRKTASAESSVLREQDIEKAFKQVSAPGKVTLLRTDGTVKKMLVMRSVDPGSIDRPLATDNNRWPEHQTYADPGMSADSQMAGYTNRFVAISPQGTHTRHTLPRGAMCLKDTEEFTPDMIASVGRPVSYKGLRASFAAILFPDGNCISDEVLWVNSDGTVTLSDGEARKRVVIGTEDGQISPIVTHDTIIIPKSSRLVSLQNPSDQSAPDFVTLSTFSGFLTQYKQKMYRKVKVYTDGSDTFVSSDAPSAVRTSPMSVKEASLKLVNDFSVDPAVVRTMMHEVYAGARPGNPRAETYYITKTASVDDPWQTANIPSSQVTNDPAETATVQMPTILESPEQLQQAVQSAAQQGIKEVFDVTALKLLVRQTRVFEDISEDLPLFMRVLDSLCRKLFQFYWHTDKMEERYGLVKMKALEESIKVTLDSLSELTIFFKMRTVDGDADLGDGGGDLMEGHEL